MLTFLDPLAAVLLLARPRLGAMLTVAIITSDVVLNAWVGAMRVSIERVRRAEAVLVFLLAIARFAWLRRRSLVVSGSVAR